MALKSTDWIEWEYQLQLLDQALASEIQTLRELSNEFRREESEAENKKREFQSKRQFEDGTTSSAIRHREWLSSQVEAGEKAAQVWRKVRNHSLELSQALEKKRIDVNKQKALLNDAKRSAGRQVTNELPAGFLQRLRQDAQAGGQAAEQVLRVYDAACAGDAKAQLLLGKALVTGDRKPLPKDVDRGRLWLESARARGQSEASESLKGLPPKSPEVPSDVWPQRKIRNLQYVVSEYRIRIDEKDTDYTLPSANSALRAVAKHIWEKPDTWHVVSAVVVVGRPNVFKSPHLRNAEADASGDPGAAGFHDKSSGQLERELEALQKKMEKLTNILGGDKSSPAKPIEWLKIPSPDGSSPKISKAHLDSMPESFRNLILAAEQARQSKDSE
ncbi:MAG: hypothetical protein AAFM91_17620 [Pseudomonadota bacterium]